jgi:hypothetical protein
VSFAPRSQSYGRELLGAIPTVLAHENELALPRGDDEAVLAPKSSGGADDHGGCMGGAWNRGSRRPQAASAGQAAYHDCHFCNGGFGRSEPKRARGASRETDRRHVAVSALVLSRLMAAQWQSRESNQLSPSPTYKSVTCVVINN